MSQNAPERAPDNAPGHRKFLSEVLISLKFQLILTESIVWSVLQVLWSTSGDLASAKRTKHVLQLFSRCKLYWRPITPEYALEHALAGALSLVKRKTLAVEGGRG